MWPLNSSDRPPPVPACLAISCGRPDEVQSRRDQRLARHCVAVGLPEVGARARLAQQLGEVLLQRGFIARRVADVAGRRVERDQRRRERDEVVAARFDRLADASLDVCQRHAAHDNVGNGMMRGLRWSRCAWPCALAVVVTTVARRVRRRRRRARGSGRGRVGASAPVGRTPLPGAAWLHLRDAGRAARPRRPGRAARCGLPSATRVTRPRRTGCSCSSPAARGSRASRSSSGCSRGSGQTCADTAW